MSARNQTLFALAGVLMLAALFALVPHEMMTIAYTAPPAVGDESIDAPAANVPQTVGRPALGSVDGVMTGSVAIVVARGAASHGRAVRVLRVDSLDVNGWAATSKKDLAKRIVYRVDALPWQSVRTRIHRPDVAAALTDPRFTESGFVAHVLIRPLGRGLHTLVFAVVDGSHREPIDEPLTIDLR